MKSETFIKIQIKPTSFVASFCFGFNAGKYLLHCLTFFDIVEFM